MRKIVEFIVIGLFQYVFIQLVTFLASLAVSPLTDDPTAQPGLFALFLTVTFTLGVFLAGWLSLKFKWLNEPPKLLFRFLGALIGAGVPLLIGLLIFKTFEPGNPIFTVSMLVSIIGFHLPTWMGTQSTK